MKIYVNGIGQVTRISDSFLVANNSYDLSIDIVFEGLAEQKKEKLTHGYLSIIRPDGFEVCDLAMSRSLSGENLVFSYKVTDSSKVLAVAGSIQISAQIKALKEEYANATQEELQNPENYYTLATVSCAGFVQKNISAPREVSLAQELLNNHIAPFAGEVAKLQHDVVAIEEEVAGIVERELVVDEAISPTSENPVQNKAIAEALNTKADQSRVTAIEREVTALSQEVDGKASQQTVADVLSDLTKKASKTELEAVSQAVNGKQDKLQAGTGIIISGNVISATAVSGDSTVSENGKNYVDLSEYVAGGVINHTAFNAKIAELVLQSKGGQDRVEIYFYQSGSDPFAFDDGIVWQSNCNYHYMGLSNYSTTEGITLNSINNCRFYGFSVYMVVSNKYALTLAGCSNIEFYDCNFENSMHIAVNISNSRSIYFSDSSIYGGNYPSQQACAVVSDNGTSAGTFKTPSWIIFENCYFHQATVDASEPLVDCSNVTNTRSLVSILHCVTNNMEDVTASNVSKGSGKIRISQLTNV